MIQEFQIRVLPEQAANEQSLKQFIGHDKGLDIRTIHALRILKRSIDARQRTIYVNLKYAYILMKCHKMRSSPVLYIIR